MSHTKLASVTWRPLTCISFDSHQLSKESVWRLGRQRASASAQLSVRAWSGLGEEWRLGQTDPCFPLISVHKKAVGWHIMSKWGIVYVRLLQNMRSGDIESHSSVSWFEVHLLYVSEWTALPRCPPSGFFEAFVWRSEPEKVHCRRLETSGTTDRPRMIQLTAPWTATLGPPVRPNQDSRGTGRAIRIIHSCWLIYLVSELRK